jgi:hypothetical protein
VWLYSVDDRWDAARVLLDRLPNIILCMLVKLFSIKTCHESMTRSCGKASDAAASNCSLGGCVLGLDGLGGTGLFELASPDPKWLAIRNAHDRNL